jgi:hypothetical protein
MLSEQYFLSEVSNYPYGLTPQVIRGAVEYTHHILDQIDAQLGADSRLSSLVELANLSAIVGNLFRNGVCQASGGMYKANLPHKYPDLLAAHPDASDIEIKVALESNKPKGHLIKPGPHITVRYVLVCEAGIYTRGKQNRGVMPWIWEVRVGELAEGHFNFSNTEGDSGKTAVINAAGMDNLKVIYFDPTRCPLVRGL